MLETSGDLGSNLIMSESPGGASFLFGGMMKRQVTLCLLVKDNQVLLGMKKTGFGNGRYNGFGGKQKDGETIPQAAVRELREECGVFTEEQHLHKVGELDFQFPKKPEWNQIMHIYFVKQWTGEPRETPEMTAEWFAREDVPYDKMWEADAHWLPLVLAGHYVKGSYVYSEEQKLLEKNIETSLLRK